MYYSKELEEYLQNTQEGITKVFLVKSSLGLFEPEIARKKGFLLTDEIRTIIDLFADKKAYVTEPLLKKTMKAHYNREIIGASQMELVFF